MSPHRRILTCIIFLGLLLLTQQSTYGWNATGHMLVARVAWDNLSPAARQQMVDLLMQAPSNSCLRQLFPNDSRPLIERQREFFMLAATWPDVIRPGKNDTRPCIRYHQRDWHFVDHFWSGTSGSATNPPHDLPIPIDEINAGEKLHFFRSLLGCNVPATERAMTLAWILHLVGDIHQPLHTSGRVTSFPGEDHGDAGGNSFKLEPGPDPKKNLHSYWDNIIDNRVPQQANESFRQYIERLSVQLEQAHPAATFNTTLNPGNIDAWILESLEKAKANAYPATLQRKQWPNQQYANNTFQVSHRSIAQAGYRLANMLSQLFGS